MNDCIDDETKLLAVDGIVGQKTLAAISEFQTSYTGETDGRIDPDGQTLKRLAQLHIENIAGGMNPEAISAIKAYSPLSNQPVKGLVHEYWRSFRNS